MEARWIATAMVGKRKDGWFESGRRALTFVVEWEVLSLTLNPRTPMANL